MLRVSFRPGREIAALHSYLHSREQHLNYAASHIQHMQKALTFMNLQLHHVVSDITGATGMQIIRAIVAGERNSDVIAEMRHRTKQSNDVNFDVRFAMYPLAGTDLTHIHCIDPFLALRLIAKCGTYLTRWRQQNIRPLG